MSLHIPVESVSPPYLLQIQVISDLEMIFSFVQENHFVKELTPLFSARRLYFVVAHLSLNLAFTLLFFECCPLIVFSFTTGKA